MTGGGATMVQYISSNTFVEANINADSGPIAFRYGGTTTFEHQNWVGTERLRTTYNGSVQAQITNLPFGDGYASTTSQYDDRDFAGLNRDQETNEEQALYREYAPTQGHWLSPDPYLGSYDFTNPQSFNRYAYVQNNPVGSLDPSGLNCAVGVSGCALNCANDPACSGLGLGSGGGSSGCQPGNASCGGGSDPFFPSCCGALGQNDQALMYPGSWYQQQVNCGFWGACGPPQGDLEGTTIWVFCGGDLFDLDCMLAPWSAGLAYNGGSHYYTGLGGLNALANQVSGQAGWIGTPAGVAAFYGASAAIAGLGSLETMDVAVGEIDGNLHFAYGVDGEWFHFMSVPGGSGYQAPAMAAEFAADSWFTFPLPVMNSGAVLPEFAAGAANCFTAVCGGFLRGWIP
jgi:RHS repeat-associated protein